MNFDFDPERMLRSHFAAGALGAIVALRLAPGASLLERVGNVAAGSACAGYFAPALVEWFEIASPGMSAAIAFGVGMFGLSVAAAVMEAIREMQLGEIITGWLRRRG